MSSKKNIEPINIVFKPFPVQWTALQYLYDDETTTVFFGGSARSSKSYLSCAWITMCCLQYPNFNTAIARSRITYLRKTTLITLFQFFRDQNIIEDVHYNFNRSDNIITFLNGSRIFLIELYLNPSDNEYNRILSMSIQAGVIDECSEIPKIGYETLLTRLTPYPNFKPKLLIVSNPTKNWIYTDYYLKYKDGTLPKDRKVVLALPEDNLSIGKEYKEQQETILSEPVKQRLLYGNWEYDQEDHNVFKYENLLNCFYADVKNGEMYLSADIADVGKDKTVISIFNGFEIIDIIEYSLPTDQVEVKIKELIAKYKIHISRTVIDASGLGVGVSNRLKGSYAFKGGSSALNKDNYKNLRNQCIIKLSEYIERGEIKLFEPKRNEILKEFSQLKYDNVERDRVEVESKQKLKERIGKSSDYLDSIYMRFVFEIKPSNKVILR